MALFYPSDQAIDERIAGQTKQLEQNVNQQLGKLYKTIDSLTEYLPNQEKSYEEKLSALGSSFERQLEQRYSSTETRVDKCIKDVTKDITEHNLKVDNLIIQAQSRTVEIIQKVEQHATDISHKSGKETLAQVNKIISEAQQQLRDQIEALFLENSEQQISSLSDALKQVADQYRDDLKSVAKKKSTDILTTLENLDQQVSEIQTKLTDKLKPIQVNLPNQTSHIIEGPVHYQFETLLKVVGSVRPTPIMLVGPTGCGKTTIARNLAKAFGMKFYFNGAIDSSYMLKGFIDARSQIVKTPFRTAFTQGGVYLFDEIDASHPNATLAFNAALSNRMADFPTTEDGQAPHKVHEDFICIAAANTFGRGADRIYVGRNHLDAAFLDRFIVFEVHYDHQLELSLVGEKGKEFAKTVQDWRHRAQELAIRHVISTRAVMSYARLRTHGFSEAEASKIAVWKGLDSCSIQKIKGL